jgi:hypothetical protein
MAVWEPVDDATAETLTRELFRELPRNHVLAGVEVRAVARRRDSDDVAFRLTDGRLCVVHLTWRAETDPAWPRVAVLASGATLMQNLRALASHLTSSAPHPPHLSLRLLERAGTSAHELRTLYEAANGGYAFDSALHVLPATEEFDEWALASWNDPHTWLAEYGDLAPDALVFAQDVLGDQFCVSSDGVFRFVAETGEMARMASTLDEWAALVLGDINDVTGRPFALRWRAAHGELPPGKRLGAKVPFVVGGSYDIDNMYVADSVSLLRLRGHVAKQLRDVPDGEWVQIKTT